MKEPTFQRESILLERFKVGAQVVLSREFAEEADVEIVTDWVVEMLTVRVRQTIWGREVGHRVIEYPADWWQAFKEHWFPCWALRRWPVRNFAMRIQTRDLFPEIAIPPGARRVLAEVVVLR